MIGIWAIELVLAALLLTSTELLARVASSARFRSVPMSATNGVASLSTWSLLSLSVFWLARQDHLLSVFIVFVILCVLARWDIRTGHIFNLSIIPLSVFGIANTFYADALSKACLGMLVMGFCTLAIHVIGAGKCIGLGDVKVLVIIGAIVGPAGGIYILIDALVIGAAIGTAVLLRTNFRRTTIPFMPAIALSVGSSLLARFW